MFGGNLTADVPDIPNMALLKPGVLDPALKFHKSSAFPDVVPVTRASVQQSHSEDKDVPKGKFGLKCFPDWGRQIEAAAWKGKGSSDEVEAHRKHLILISSTRTH